MDDVWHTVLHPLTATANNNTTSQTLIIVAIIAAVGSIIAAGVNAIQKRPNGSRGKLTTPALYGDLRKAQDRASTLQQKLYDAELRAEHLTEQLAVAERRVDRLETRCAEAEERAEHLAQVIRSKGIEP